MVTALGSMRNMELMGTSVFGDLVCPMSAIKLETRSQGQMNLNGKVCYHA